MMHIFEVECPLKPLKGTFGAPTLTKLLLMHSRCSPIKILFKFAQRAPKAKFWDLTLRAQLKFFFMFDLETCIMLSILLIFVFFGKHENVSLGKYKTWIRKPSCLQENVVWWFYCILEIRQNPWHPATMLGFHFRIYSQASFEWFISWPI